MIWVSDLALIEALATAASGCWTSEAAAAAVLGALPDVWNVRRLEYGYLEDHNALRCMFATPKGRGPHRGPRPVIGSLAGTLLRSKDVVHYVGPAAIHFAEADGRDDRMLLGMPLCVPKHHRRTLVLVAEISSAMPNANSGLWRAFGRVVEGVFAHTELVGKVAALSNRAHHDNKRLLDELAHLRRPGYIVAESEAMRTSLDLAASVAPHDTTVLLHGESGTGKEVLARFIHERSSRRGGPLVAVNCGALPEALIESELFGHVKGAFTGASREHTGKFERADGGTLFLDEVGELTAGAQVKLLRVLQERRLEPVGGSETRGVDVRVIAASHHALDERAAQGLFRSDLYYRLNVFPIEIAPLRERPKDIAALTDTILERLCVRQGRPVPHIQPSTRAELCRRPWPGNVRELENTLERSLILSPGDTLELTIERGPVDEPLSIQPELVLTFDEAMRQCIAAALRAARGRVYGPHGAAKLLGLRPSTLQAKMGKLGLQRADFAASSTD